MFNGSPETVSCTVVLHNMRSMTRFYSAFTVPYSIFWYGYPQHLRYGTGVGVCRAESNILLDITIWMKVSSIWKLSAVHYIVLSQNHIYKIRPTRCTFFMYFTLKNVLYVFWTDKLYVQILVCIIASMVTSCQLSRGGLCWQLVTVNAWYVPISACTVKSASWRRKAFLFETCRGHFSE